MKTKLWSCTSLNCYDFQNEVLRLGERSILSGVFCNFCEPAFQKSTAGGVNSLQLLLRAGIHPRQVELLGFDFFSGRCSFCLAGTGDVLGDAL